MRSSDHRQEGDPTGVACPRCGAEVLYSGNYFCANWVYRGDPPRGLEADECDWALREVDEDEEGVPVDPVDRAVWDELRATYPPLRDYLARLARRTEEDP